MAATRLDYMHQPAGAARKIVARVKADQPLNSLVCRMASLTQSEAVGMTVFERLLPLEAKLPSRLLMGLSNGAFGEPLAIFTSINSAVQSIGVEPIREASLITLFDFFAQSSLSQSGIFYREATKRALATAHAARRVALTLRLDGSEAFIAGLFADLGMIMVAFAHPEIFGMALSNLSGDSRSIRDAVHGAFGFDHAQVSQYAAIEYELPEFLKSAFLNQNGAWDELKDMDFVVAFAGAVAHQLGYDYGISNIPPMIPERLLQQVTLFGCDISALADEVHRAVSRLSLLPA